MLKEPKRILIAGFLAILLLANVFLLGRVIQNQQDYQTVLQELQHQSVAREQIHLDRYEEMSASIVQLELEIREQNQALLSTFDHLDRLAEENETLKKKLQ